MATHFGRQVYNAIYNLETHSLYTLLVYVCIYDKRGLEAC